TPTAVPALAAMPLAERGSALSVNHDGWISYREDTRTSAIGYASGVTWAPDAEKPSVPLPKLPCDGQPPEACFHRFDTILEVGDDGWMFGDHVTFGSGGPFIPLPALFGPDRSSMLLIEPEDPPVDLDTIASFAAHLCAAAQVAGTLTLREDGSPSPVRRPALWPAPYQRMLFLPSGDAGAAAVSCDRSLRVAGVADAPSRAAVWLPDPLTGYAQVLLPIDGADASAALAIDVGQVVGWRSDATRSTPVAWIETADGFAASLLPDLPGARCERATATSGTRVAGDCGLHGVAWDRSSDGAGWRVVAELLPLPGDAQASVVAMSGDLAVGWSGAGDDVVDKHPVAWRLPPH
ncbi:MAG: hypothetical protein U0842_23485, partial [Candidatus Binatia bacterium]